ncbi:hypothetical protein EXIGLDRAFT_672967 [Exidia glandulosa HHB12029]|uniref:Uncharacterized protein n=1 Tax=Exidia glandulosa HHB12029 TaxID=1314781 RepID=A0A165JB35_EXIGL|nr:hypothetical protein EXIGLDRAFT_672967 [Exidia glandulosa HHB12029]
MDLPQFDLSGIKASTLFLPIPNADPLNTLLTKYVPQPEKRPHRDLSGAWHKTDFHTLVMTNSWRALATMARDRIVMSTQDPSLALGLWHVRLASLARLRLFNQTIAECGNLFAVLHAIEPVAAREYVLEYVVPFELHVMHARLKYWAANPLGYMDDLNALLRSCKIKSKTAPPDDIEMWKERAARLCLMIATQLLELKNFTSAARLLEPLCSSSAVMRSAVARIYLQAGLLEAAAAHFALVDADEAAGESTKSLNHAMLSIAKGDWFEAQRILASLLEANPEDAAVANNLAVSLLSSGKVLEATEILESSLQLNPSLVTAAEPLLFNLATLYELRSTTAMDKKRDLLIEAAKHCGDGLRTTCLKLPSQ